MVPRRGKRPNPRRGARPPQPTFENGTPRSRTLLRCPADDPDRLTEVAQLPGERPILRGGLDVPRAEQTRLEPVVERAPQPQLPLQPRERDIAQLWAPVAEPQARPAAPSGKCSTPAPITSRTTSAIRVACLEVQVHRKSARSIGPRTRRLAHCSRPHMTTPDKRLACWRVTRPPSISGTESRPAFNRAQCHAE